MAQISRYPAKVMNITQSYKGSFSHSKNYNGSPRDYPVDEACTDAGRSYFYAPFDCVVKRIYGVGSKGVNTIWIQSTAPVQTPAFTDHVTVMVIHPNDDTLRRLRVGQLFRKGTAMFLEGTDGRATGNHFHISCGRGRFRGNGWWKNSLGKFVIDVSGGAVPPEKAFYVDTSFTSVRQTKGLAFRRITGGTAGSAGPSGASGSAGVSGGGSASSTGIGRAYKVGRTVTLQVNLNVRSGPGTNYTRKKRSQLTANGKKHALNGVYAVYRKGTRVTIMAVRSIGADVWIKTPSGWICGKKGSRIYVK